MQNDMITKRLKIISDLEDEARRVKALYQEALEEMPSYQQLQERQEKLKEEAKEEKSKVKTNDTLIAMEEQMKQARDEIKENREILAQELADYYKDSGSMEIVDADGVVKRFTFSVKLVDQK